MSCYCHTEVLVKLYSDNDIAVASLSMTLDLFALVTVKSKHNDTMGETMHLSLFVLFVICHACVSACMLYLLLLYYVQFKPFTGYIKL